MERSLGVFVVERPMLERLEGRAQFYEKQATRATVSQRTLFGTYQVRDIPRVSAHLFLAPVVTMLGGVPFREVARKRDGLMVSVLELVAELLR